MGCHYDASSNQLLMMAGTDGNLGFWPLPEQGDASGVMVGASMLPPVMILQGSTPQGPQGSGHSAVVRTVQCFGDGSGTAPFCLTGGEDARLCMWSLQAAASGSGVAQQLASSASDMDVSVPAAGPERHNHKVGKAVRRPSPY